MKLKIKVFTILISLSLILAATISSASLLSMTSVSDTYNVNESFSIDLVIQGLETDQVLAAFDFNVVFDSSVFTLDSYVLGDNLGILDLEAFDWSVIDSGSGSINLLEYSTLPDTALATLQTEDAFVMATLNFTANSVVTYSAIGYATYPFVFSDGLGNDISPTAATGLSVSTVAPVPEPSSMLLFGTGLTALVGFRIRRKK